jgi:hypothetical protein
MSIYIINEIYLKKVKTTIKIWNGRSSMQQLDCITVS